MRKKINNIAAHLVAWLTCYAILTIPLYLIVSFITWDIFWLLEGSGDSIRYAIVVMGIFSTWLIFSPDGQQYLREKNDKI